MIARSLQAAEPRRDHEILAAHLQQLAPDDPRQPGQLVSARISVIAKYVLTGSQPVGTAALRPIQSGIVGIEIRNSTTRWIRVSTAPP